MELFVFQAKAKNVGEALKAALEYEAFLVGRARRTGAHKPRDVRAQFQNRSGSLSVEEQLRAELAEVKEQLAKLTHSSVAKPTSSAKPVGKVPKSSKAKGNCHYCGKKGHFVAQCYKKQRDEASRDQPNVNGADCRDSGAEEVAACSGN